MRDPLDREIGIAQKLQPGDVAPGGGVFVLEEPGRSVLFVLEWKLALLLFLALPFCILGPRILGPRALTAGSRLRKEQGVLASMVVGLSFMPSLLPRRAV